MKATASGRDPYIALLEYRTTPISDCGKSPAQLLMSRRLRSILPSTPASLQPDLVNPEATQRRFEEKQEKQKMFYNRNAKTRAGISVGDQILLRKNTGGYQSAVITEKADIRTSRHPYIALFEYRTTPISDCGKLPAQLLMSRRLRSILPSTGPGEPRGCSTALRREARETEDVLR